MECNMKRLITLTAITLFTLTACATKHNPRGSACTLSSSQPSCQIELAANPTTGYGWMAHYDQALLKAKRSYKKPETDRIGAGGHDIWTFTATSQALHANTTQKTLVRMIYARPWEHNKKPAQTKIIGITFR